MSITEGVAAEPARRPKAMPFIGLVIAVVVVGSVAIGVGVTGTVAAIAADGISVSAARDLAEMKAARAAAEDKAQACLTAFTSDRAALEQMVASAGDLNTALKTVSDSGWPQALPLIGSATEHLLESKKSIAQANAANCTE